MSFPRKRPQSQGSSNGGNSGGSGGQHRRPRFSGGHSNNGGGNGGGNRPRKNYGAMREKYLNQARDALSAGDRVLAENYFQHADHCFRMMAEEAASRPQRNPQHNRENNNQPADDPVAENESELTADAEAGTPEVEEEMPIAIPTMPAFLTAGYIAEKPEGEPVAEPPHWEEE